MRRVNRELLGTYVSCIHFIAFDERALLSRTRAIVDVADPQIKRTCNQPSEREIEIAAAVRNHHLHVVAYDVVDACCSARASATARICRRDAQLMRLSVDLHS